MEHWRGGYVKRENIAGTRTVYVYKFHKGAAGGWRTSIFSLEFTIRNGATFLRFARHPPFRPLSLRCFSYSLIFFFFGESCCPHTWTHTKWQDGYTRDQDNTQPFGICRRKETDKKREKDRIEEDRKEGKKGKMARVNSTEYRVGRYQWEGRPRVSVDGVETRPRFGMWVGSAASVHPPGYGRVLQSAARIRCTCRLGTRSYVTAAADRHASNLN